MTRLLQTAITERAGARPEAAAVLSPDGSLTYGELDTASNRLAHMLRELGCRRGDRVGLLMPKVPAAIVGLLGVLKADAAYVPLDPACPPARLARMLEVSGCHSILAAGRTGALLRAVLACANLPRRPLLGWQDDAAPPETGMMCAFTAADLPALPATLPSSANRDTDLAQILFTSGASGAPKGVMITHYGVLQFLEWALSYFGLSSADRVSQHPPLHFDLSTFDVFGTLTVGAQLHLTPPAFNLLPHKLAQFIRSARLTQWFSLPSILTLLAKFDVLHQGDFPELRRVIWCGEVIPTPTLVHWMRCLPHVRFTNLYGPTETTIASSHYTLTRCPAHEQEEIPIGTACAGEELLILDEDLQPVGDGETGDLYIRGVGLSPGYWSEPERTRSAFLPFPPGTDTGERIYRTGDRARRGSDGLIYFAGRRDQQIRSRSHRIELGEIEVALATLAELRESAVVAVESQDFEGWMICCAYVPLSGHSVDPRQLRARLARLLPTYMLPTRWMRCGTLPRNPDGKVDRPDLRRRFSQAEQQFCEGAIATAASIPGAR
ncbi:MAG TPA: amino acid adenylation domain-containing protein [Steroidobacteraceae bacterium]|nr:amino acid adenylation domain-containing protein [Steroidobacteraceae bacterium]